MVSISRWEFERPRETLRLAAVTLEALARQGAENPADHMIVLLDSGQSNDAVKFGTVIASPTPFTAERVARVQERAQDTVISIAYAPGIDQGHDVFRSMVLAPDRAAFFAGYEFDVTPVFDERPFFFFMSRWSSFFDNMNLFEASGDTVATSAQNMLVALLAISTLAVGLFIFVPMMLFRDSFPMNRRFTPNLLFCVAVGLAYILVEIALIHKFVVYLGQPVYSLTVVIFAFLLSSSLGSRFSQRFDGEGLRTGAMAAVGAITATAFVYSFAAPFMISVTQTWMIQIKLFLVAASIFPLGFLMGIPFPCGLRMTADSGNQGIEWAWALNSAGTVMGSILAMFVAVNLGLTWTLASGVFCYLGAGVALRFMLAGTHAAT